MDAEMPPPASKKISRPQVGWFLYDFANSAYTTVIVTVVYSTYFTEVVAKEDGVVLWGRGVALSMILIALISPVLGAMADDLGHKKRFLGISTLISAVFTALLYFVEAGDRFTGLLFFIVSNMAFNAALIFYDAFLTELTDATWMGRLSGYGWAIGYVGGFFSLLIILPLIGGGFEVASLPRFRLSFVVTALFYLIFSIPFFIWVQERAIQEKRSPGEPLLMRGFLRVRETFRHATQFKELMKYIVAFFLYNDAINTVIIFSAVFATRVLHFTPAELITYFLTTQISAAIGAALFAPVTDRLGPKQTISITLLGWIIVVIWAYFVETATGFYGLGCLAGSILGATQSASRTLLAQFTPVGKSAEFFGLFALTGRLSASAGPLFYGEIVRWTGSQRWATLSLLIFFVFGLLLLQTVEEQKGREAAV